MTAPAQNPEDVGHSAVAAAWFGVLCAGVIAIFGIGVALGMDGEDLVINAFACAITFFGFLPLVIDQARPVKQRHILLTLWSGAWVVYFAVPVWTLYFMSGSRIMVTGLPDLLAPDIQAALGIVLLGQIAFLLSYATPLPGILCSGLPKVKYDWNPNMAVGLGALMIPLGSAVWVGSAVGIIPKSLGSGWLGAVASGSFFGCALLTIVYLRFKTPLALFFLYVLVPATMALYFFSSMKEKLFSPVMYIVIALIVTTRRVNARWVLIGFVAFVLYYPIAEVLRGTVAGQSVGETLSNPGAALTDLKHIQSDYESGGYLDDGLSAASNRLSALPMAAVVIHDTPSRVPYQGGWSLSYAVIGFIPRALWPGKPIFDVGKWVTDNYGTGSESSTAVSWIGDFYMNFGTPGVFFGMIFMGFFFRMFHELLFRQESVPTLFAATIAAYTISRSIENFIFAPVSGLVMNLMMIVIVHFFARDLSRPLDEPIANPASESFGAETEQAGFVA